MRMGRRTSSADLLDLPTLEAALKSEVLHPASKRISDLDGFLTWIGSPSFVWKQRMNAAVK